MAIIRNEHDIPDLQFFDNPEAWMGIGNAEYFLDEHYKEVTKPRTAELVRSISHVISESLPLVVLLTGHLPRSNRNQPRDYYHD